MLQGFRTFPKRPLFLFFSMGLFIATAISLPPGAHYFFGGRAASANIDHAGPIGGVPRIPEKGDEFLTVPGRPTTRIDNVDDEKPHTLAASFYDVESFTSAKLLLNNKDIVAREIRPTLYGSNGQILEIAPVTVEPTSFQMIDLKEWAATGGADFRRGSIRLFHTGKDLVIGSEVYLQDEARSLSFEEKLHEIGTYDSRRLEGVLYMPTRGTEAKLVISNTGEETLNVSAGFSRMPRREGGTQTILLLPHQTKVIDLAEHLGERIDGDAIGVSLTHDGSEGALLARAMVYDSDKGYSMVAPLENPSSKKTSELHGAGFKLEETLGEKLLPVVAVRNVGGLTSTVRASIPYSRTDGTTNTIVLPELRLRAGEIGLIDMRKAAKIAETEELATAGLEIEYDTEPGSIVAHAQSIGESGSQVFGMMLWDVMSHRSSTGGYPFYIEGTSTTRAYIKNGTDREMDYVTYLTHGNGEQYMIGLRRLGAHQTVEIDVKAIRDRQIPDETGKVLPMDTTRGQIQWTVRPRMENEGAEVPDNLGLIGQSEQHDAERGMNTSYYCENCCPGSYAWSIIVPGDTEIAFEVGKTIPYVHIEVQDNCYGAFYQFNTTSLVSWSSTLTSVAVMSGNVVTVIGVGEAQIKATFTATAWAAIPCLPGEDPPFLVGNAGDEDEAGFFSTFARRPRGPSAEEDLMLMPQPYHRTTAATRTAPALFLPTCGTCVSAHSNVSPSKKLTVRDVVVTVDDVDLIEKNTTRAVNVTVSGGGGGITTRIRISTVVGTGSATFDDGSVEKVIMGNTVQGSPVVLTIKGVTESSTVNNLELRATIDWLSTPKKIDPFSVATITALAFERINTTGTSPDVALDNNPGNGQPGTNVGQRIFPDKNWPEDTTDRATLRVRATIMPANVPNLRVYFAGFDLDDPSADIAPIDTNGANGVDNNGAVNGSKSGEFSSGTETVCGMVTPGVDPLYIGMIDCPVAGNTTAANFKVTMQPGDNFAVAASLDRAYRDGVRVNTTAGANLTDSAGQTIPISGQTNPNNVRGIRTNMLTVWRRLRIETDEMTNVTSQNNAKGNFSVTGTIPGGSVFVPVPVEFNNALAEQGRFQKGRIMFGSAHSLEVAVHSATSVTVKSDAEPIQVNSGEAFVIYDDDDYNSDDTLLDGDDSEPIDPIANLFGTSYDQPYKEAYIVFDLTTLSQYGQSNVPFDLNLDTTSITALNTLFTNNRGSASKESDDFWVAYLILGYQGAKVEDFDGFTNCQGATCQTEAPLFAATLSPSQNCDCLNSSSCPSSGVACIAIPQGGHGSVILQEVIRDHKFFFQSLFGRTITVDQSTIAHEIAHQFGIMGDDLNALTFKIMDYPDFDAVDGPEHRFHPEHVNILRRRVRSPGQQ